jgi:hypothetical protein
VRSVLDTPLRSRHLSEPRYRKRCAQQIIRRIRRGLALGLAPADHLSDCCQTRPRMLLLHPANISADRPGSGLDAAMIGIDRRVRGLARPIRGLLETAGRRRAGCPDCLSGRSHNRLPARQSGRRSRIGHQVCHPPEWHALGPPILNHVTRRAPSARHDRPGSMKSGLVTHTLPLHIGGDSESHTYPLDGSAETP